MGTQVYTERMKREYKVETEVGKPRVNFREKITKRVDFDYLHKKQSGGQGQYGRVIGHIEPMTEEELEELDGEKFEFVNGCIGNNIPPGFIPSIEKVRPSFPIRLYGQIPPSRGSVCCLSSCSNATVRSNAIGRASCVKVITMRWYSGREGFLSGVCRIPKSGARVAESNAIHLATQRPVARAHSDGG